MHYKSKIRLLAVGLLWVGLGACVMSSKKSLPLGPLPLPENYGPLPKRQITNYGENLRPSLSPDGTRLVYVSRLRSQHEQYQAYELKIGANVDKRITYQNGEVYDIAFSNGGQRYVYSSSTDELKENPPYIENALRKLRGENPKAHHQLNDKSEVLPNTEIYRARLDSSRIERITQTPRFDGDISVRGKRHEIAYVRWTNGRPQVNIANMKTKNTSVVGNDQTWSSDPAFSPDGEELAWVEKSSEDEYLILTGTAYGKNGRMRYKSGNRIRHLVWSPDGDGIYFVEQSKHQAEVFHLNLSSACKRQITFHSALDFHPYPSPGGGELYFSSNRTGEFQIHWVQLQGLPPCSPDKANIE